MEQKRADSYQWFTKHPMSRARNSDQWQGPIPDPRPHNTLITTINNLLEPQVQRPNKMEEKLRSHKYNSTDKLTVEWPTHCTRPRIYVVKQYQWAVVWAHVDSSLLFAAGHPSPTAIACCQVRSMNRLRLIDFLGNANVPQSKPMRTQVY